MIPYLVELALLAIHNTRQCRLRCDVQEGPLTALQLNTICMHVWSTQQLEDPGASNTS